MHGDLGLFVIFMFAKKNKMKVHNRTTSKGAMSSSSLPAKERDSIDRLPMS